MKTRKRLVSNSSSSSFVVTGKTPPRKCDYVELKGQTAANVCLRGNLTPGKDDQVWLTNYFSDYCEEEIGCFKEVERFRKYMEGGHDGPYSTDDYIEVGPNVWVWKRDYNED